jgi:hypothetical protein
MGEDNGSDMCREERFLILFSANFLKGEDMCRPLHPGIGGFDPRGIGDLDIYAGLINQCGGRV